MTPESLFGSELVSIAFMVRHTTWAVSSYRGLGGCLENTNTNNKNNNNIQTLKTDKSQLKIYSQSDKNSGMEFV